MNEFYFSGESTKATSTTGIPILEGASPEPMSSEQLLLSTRSPLLLASLRRASGPSLGMISHKM